MDKSTIPRAARLLQAWRRRARWSQTEAALHIGLDQARYSQLERGKRKPGLDWAVRIERRTDGRVPVEAWSTRPRRTAVKKKPAPPAPSNNDAPDSAPVEAQ